MCLRGEARHRSAVSRNPALDSLSRSGDGACQSRVRKVRPARGLRSRVRAQTDTPTDRNTGVERLARRSSAAVSVPERPRVCAAAAVRGWLGAGRCSQRSANGRCAASFSSELTISRCCSELGVSRCCSERSARGRCSKLAASGYRSKLSARARRSKHAARGSSKLAASGRPELAAPSRRSKLAARGSSELAARARRSELAARGSSKLFAELADGCGSQRVTGDAAERRTCA
jgi:hypothetical protein